MKYLISGKLTTRRDSASPDTLDTRAANTGGTSAHGPQYLYPERDDDRRVLAAFLRQCDDEHSTCHGILGPGLMFSLLRLASDGFTDDAVVSACAGIRMQDIEELRRMCDNERAV